MSNPSDFVIENGVLTKYTGPGGDVVIPENVTTIGACAFSKCSNLTSVTIPEGVTSVMYQAFYHCTNLTSVTIPGSVTSIGIEAFDGCRNLMCAAIPAKVTSIGNRAFSECSKLTSIIIPAGVMSIGYKVFYRCSSLTNVVIPEGVTNIADKAFSGCSSLMSLTILGSVTNIGDSAFCWCSSLTHVTISDGVKSIGKEAFSNCRNLVSVIIPASVTSIGKWAFDGCSNLSTIISSTKLDKGIFDSSFSKPIITNDPGNLPAKMKPLAAVGFAETSDDPKSERGKKHTKYIKANAAKLTEEAFAHPTLLRLMCENKLLTPEVTEAYLAAAQETGNAEITAMLLDYQQNKLTEKEKAKAAQKAETREEKVTDFVFSVEALEQLQGKVFVVTGKLNTFSSREEFKACLDVCGAILSETLNEQTNYLITNTPNSGSAKNKKAEALGVIKLSETEFNNLIGRKQE